MSIPKKLAKVIQKLYRQLLKISRTLTKGVMTWLLRRLMVLRHRSGLAGAGFILPTVTMVILVVILLTTAIVFRSFDRAKNARNYRVSEEVMAAATPAMERATAKLDALFDDPRLPPATPSDSALYNYFEYKDDYRDNPENDKFTFPDEQRLKVAYDLNDDGKIEEGDQLENQEAVSTAWRFPVDTDGDGKFDSFTIYGIFFRSPARDGSGFKRARSPLDARTPPMAEGAGSGVCAGAQKTSAKLVSQAGWYKVGSKLKKSFFVYTATVPIVNKNELNLGGDYKEFPPGTAPGFSALEYQQDRARIPLSNNAVVFENDLALVSGSKLRLNGRITTNGNLFTTTTNQDNIELYQVSAPASCFYPDVENSKIVVGGHVINAGPLAEDYTNSREVKVHLFINNAAPDETDQVKDLDTDNQSAANDQAPRSILYDSDAYKDRVAHLVEKWTDEHEANANGYNDADPEEVKTQVRDVVKGEKAKVRNKALNAYFANRTRRVPFAEVARDGGAVKGDPQPKGTGDTLRPPDEWMFPYNPEDGESTDDGYAPIELNIDGESLKPEATRPEVLEESDRENEVGDRMLIGHNLPAIWHDEDGNAVGREERQDIEGTTWHDSSETRSRATQVTPLSDVGDKSRDGFWEKEAAKQPENLLDPVGGLRIVTGAGVYERKNSFLPPPTWDDPTTPEIEAQIIYDDPINPTVVRTTYDDPSTPEEETFPIVWPDTMPMSPMAGEIVYSNQDSAVLANSADRPDEWKGVGWKDDGGRGLPAPVGTPDSLFPELRNDNGFAAVGGANKIDPNTPKYAKGDLRMRATAVYHYADDIYQPPSEGNDQEQIPIACVSSYYDPTNATTARNPDPLPDVSGQLDWPNAQPPAGEGKSNNGVSYPPPSKTSAGIGQMSKPQGLVRGQGQEDYGNSLDKQLAYQANLVFPNGRFVNEPLREALLEEPGDRTLAQQAAIDSTICALDILGGATPDDSVIPHGAISEVAFLDSRQIQAIDQDDPTTLEVESVTNLTGNYDLPIEERQPLEVRATKIDLDKLRRQGISGSFIPEDTAEYLLPNSGIIYASRDDALPDLSNLLPGAENQLPGDGLGDEDKANALRQSAVDYKLDPTRRPSGILIFNGERLARDDNEQFRAEEKGLTLVSDLPAYIWAWSDKNGDGIVDDSDESLFNPHSHEEFKEELETENWGNFYSRGRNEGDLDPSFACRPGDDRLPDCDGDTWRPATVIADSITLLSKDFRFGFRDEGDYDLRNNHIVNQGFITNRLKSGLLANNFVTNGFSSGGITIGGTTPTEEDYSQNNNQGGNYIGSSYFNNFITPVQRRWDGAPEYVMEICRKLPVSACTAEDWVVGYDRDGDGVLTADPDPTLDEKNVTVDQLGQVIEDSGKSDGGDDELDHNDADWFVNYVTSGNSESPRQRLGAGTTALPALMEADRRYPRRVAFARTAYHTLILYNNPTNDHNDMAKPIGVGCPLDTTGNRPENNGCIYGNTADNQTYYGNRDADNVLWFRNTDTNGSPLNPGNAITYRRDRSLSYLTDANKYGQSIYVTDPGNLGSAVPEERYFRDEDIGGNPGFKLFVPKIVADPDYGAFSQVASQLNRVNAGNDEDAIAKYTFCLINNGSDVRGTTGPDGRVNIDAYTDLTDDECQVSGSINKMNNVVPQRLRDLDPDASATDAIVKPTVTPPTGGGSNLTADGGTVEAQLSEVPNATNPQKSVNVYKLPATLSTFNYGATITLRGTPESIFVLWRDGALTFGGGSPGDGVQLNLEGGVDPNNVFWFVDKGALTFKTPGTPTSYHRLAGNFINNGSGDITFGQRVRIMGGRFIGFTNVDDTNFGPDVHIYGMTAQDQPLTVPVLQLQVPNQLAGDIKPGDPFTNLAGDGDTVKATNWHQKATDSTFNLISAVANTPAREGEPDGGIGNFARLIEDWDWDGNKRTLSISGSLMQLDRSSYATGPFQPFFTLTNFMNESGGIFDYTQLYFTSNSDGKIPYNQPSDRRFGYDVGLLSQIPDEFSGRFTSPPTGKPNEFFREISRDDPWLQALLCAVTAGDDDVTAINTQIRGDCPLPK